MVAVIPVAANRLRNDRRSINIRNIHDAVCFTTHKRRGQRASQGLPVHHAPRNL